MHVEANNGKQKRQQLNHSQYLLDPRYSMSANRMAKFIKWRNSSGCKRYGLFLWKYQSAVSYLSFFHPLIFCFKFCHFHTLLFYFKLSLILCRIRSMHSAQDQREFEVEQQGVEMTKFEAEDQGVEKGEVGDSAESDASRAWQCKMRRTRLRGKTCGYYVMFLSEKYQIEIIKWWMLLARTKMGLSVCQNGKIQSNGGCAILDFRFTRASQKPHTPTLFHVKLENDGWEEVDMLWCQGAQNIGLSNHKRKSALEFTVWSQCTPVPDGRKDRQTHRHADGQIDGRTDEQYGNNATIRSTNASRAKNKYNTI